MASTQLYPSLTQVAIVSAAFKILLFPAYKSTDFEVHRNWLAITHSLPIREWYYEVNDPGYDLNHGADLVKRTSEWTLDYPPFFAYFEWSLSQLARLVDARMLELQNLGFDSWQTVFFQRFSVIFTESVLVIALLQYVQASSAKKHAHILALSVLLSPGLLIIDHIHFQYNGFLYGILLLSLVSAQKSTDLLRCGFLFATLLFFKHIYLYLAPAYFVFLLRRYCLSSAIFKQPQWLHMAYLGGTLLVVAAAALGPFAMWGQTSQLLSRLFPFSRGLCHAYWAPNVWALYSFLDRVLILVWSHLGISTNSEAHASVTRGLVGDTAFAVLPAVTPRLTFLLTLTSQSMPLVKLFLYPDWTHFVGAITLCAYSSFLFGWHVHEKAVLLIIIPFSLIVFQEHAYLAAFKALVIAGHVSLFPLIFTAQEFSIKTVYLVLWLTIFLTALDNSTAGTPQKQTSFWPVRMFSLYVVGMTLVVAYCSVIHRLIFGESRLEFLPLMLISFYTALGVVGSWLAMLIAYMWSS